MNKKASMSIVVTLIVLLISFVALGQWIFNKLYPETELIIENASCKASVQNAAAIANAAQLQGVKLQGIKSFKELKGCKTEDKTGKNAITETDPKKVRDLLANSLYTCWDNFGQSKLDFFKDFSFDNYCFVCSKFQFKNEVDISSTSLGTFMRSKEEYKQIPAAFAFAPNKISKDQRVYTVLVTDKDYLNVEAQGLFTLGLNQLNVYVYNNIFDKDLRSNLRTYVALVSQDTLVKHCRSI